MKPIKFYRSIKFKFVLALIVLVLIAVQLTSMYLVHKTEATLEEDFKTSVIERVNLMSLSVQGELTKVRAPEDETVIEALEKIARDATEGDITKVVFSNVEGTILAEYDAESSEGEQIDESKYINEALYTGVMSDEQVEDPETGDQVWVMAQPVYDEGKMVGSIYVESDIEAVYEQIDYIETALKKGTIIALALTIPIGYFIARMFTRSISEMHDNARKLSEGMHIGKVATRNKDEMGELAKAFNDMSTKLQDAIVEKESERRKLVSVLEHMSDGVVATDRRGNVILINERANRLLEIDSEEAIGMAITELLEIDDEHDYTSLIKEKDEMILELGDTTRRYMIRVRFTAIQQFEGGFINGIIAVLHDVTEEEKIESERQEFVANVSHELRTPLTTMRTYLDALSDGAMENEQLSRKFLTVVRDETERMIRLVNSLLSLSKMENGTEKLNPEWGNFNSFVNRIIDKFEMQKERNITFKRKIPDYPIYVEIDVDKMNQVIDNIISNALKYSPEGGIITFKVKLIEEEHRVEVSIRDQGMGMPKGTADKIFQRFYRVDKARSRKVGGTGLGLAIAKEIVDAHNGEIHARSIEGVGTTIIFSIPCANSEEDEWE